MIQINGDALDMIQQQQINKSVRYFGIISGELYYKPSQAQYKYYYKPTAAALCYQRTQEISPSYNKLMPHMRSFTQQSTSANKRRLLLQRTFP
ncbi:hypothetical protein FGO68_gene5895 [Halteria grandinella]|uniref:Uncharacterized protein n=1 Tax=Halteria grandinella TaxID=5974 RepID=A0A8J8T953_HALGN|nr:hypothetical protein FGO68_gene5895 [Halteria grandinella]